MKFRLAKRFLALSLAVSVAASLAGCGSSQNNAAESTDAASSESTDVAS